MILYYNNISLINLLRSLIKELPQPLITLFILLWSCSCTCRTCSCMRIGPTVQHATSKRDHTCATASQWHNLNDSHTVIVIQSKIYSKYKLIQVFSTRTKDTSVQSHDYLMHKSITNGIMESINHAIANWTMVMHSGVGLSIPRCWDLNLTINVVTGPYGYVVVVGLVYFYV